MPPQSESNAPIGPRHHFPARRSSRPLILVALSNLLVLTIYVWLISVGTWIHWPGHWSLYDALATAFRHGQLALMEKPDPALVALPDPFNPATRQGIPSPQDISLYNGRFYSYFGPVPALILAIVKFFVAGTIGDQYLVFAFSSGIFLLLSYMIVVIRRSFFADISDWALVPVILVGGLMNPFVWVVSTPSVYNAAITAGQFFFLAGFCMSFAAVRKIPVSSWQLTLSGLLWVAALGSRIVLILPIAFMAVFIALTLALQALRAGALAKSLPPMLALIGVLAIGLGELAWYNWARFGSITETGFRYQLGGLFKQAHLGELFWPGYILQNLYNYLLNLPRVRYVFPYLTPVEGVTESIVAPISLPIVYRAQQMTGILYSSPLITLALLPVISILLRHPGVLIKTNEKRWFKWLVIGLGGSFLAGAAFFIAFFWAAERYLIDFLPCLFLLSVIGLWQLDQYLVSKPRARALYWVALVGLIAFTITVSILLSMNFNSDGFRRLNPILWRQLSNLFRP